MGRAAIMPHFRRQLGAVLLGLAFGPVAPALSQAVPTPGPSQRESSGEAFDRTPENEPSAPPATRPKYQLTRWLEDWRTLANPAKRVDKFDWLKFIPLGPSGQAHLTLSGQWREELYANNGGALTARGDRYGLHPLSSGSLYYRAFYTKTNSYCHAFQSTIMCFNCSSKFQFLGRFF